MEHGSHHSRVESLLYLLVKRVPSVPDVRADQQHWTPEQRARLTEYARERTEAAIEEDPFGAYTEARDRALVAMLYYAVVRGAGGLRHRQDERDGRQGLRWSRVDLDAEEQRERLDELVKEF